MNRHQQGFGICFRFRNFGTTPRSNSDQQWTGLIWEEKELRRTPLPGTVICIKSLSLVIVLWGLPFLLSLWISQGDGHKDKTAKSSIDMSMWEEAERLQSGVNSSLAGGHPPV
ncbi:hypothetical protein F8388_012011 [Cannabis sativa]|uniref:Uncharacterized protein n=1 Tax=Cannabis sativa TaxID=3483 RepID=A0A7J6GF04_CANSA|nr:hypothetical protein F8388_012011 [Cannabis sativa]KAF4381473.1 hypothetical protein G4B88_029828 [Cannabis sativa]